MARPIKELPYGGDTTFVLFDNGDLVSRFGGQQEAAASGVDDFAVLEPKSGEVIVGDGVCAPAIVVALTKDGKLMMISPLYKTLTGTD
jgi:hypothetical protein